MNARTVFALLALASACDNSARNEQIATVEKKTDEPDEKALAERKEKRLAAEKAKADAAEAVRAEIVKVAVVGDKPTGKPRGLAEACEAVADAQDRFVARLGSDDAKAKWAAGRENQRPMAIIQCTSADSTAVASCQVNGLDNASPALAEQMQAIIDYCVEKFAPPRQPGTLPAGGGQIPKRPK